MSVFKEEMSVIEEFARKQKQIYPDAADFGVYLNAQQTQMLREAVQELRRYCHTKPVERFDGDACSTTRTQVFVGWERDGDVVRGTLVTIDTCKMKIGKSAGKTLFTFFFENQQMSRNSFENTKTLGV